MDLTSFTPCTSFGALGVHGAPWDSVALRRATHRTKNKTQRQHTEKQAAQHMLWGVDGTRNGGGLDSRGPAVEVRLAVVPYEEFEVHFTGVCPLLH